MRKRAGIGAIQDKRAAQEKFRGKGNELQENLIQELSLQLSELKEKLESFAAKHRKTIRKDPEFREHFQNMCASIGVDPLASSKGFWSELLGMGSFYYEIAVQAVEIVLATAHLNGGVMTLGELLKRLNKSRNKSLKHSEISSNDILRAMKSLSVLGKSCGVISAGSGASLENSLVFCVPEELSLDTTSIVQHVAKSKSLFLTKKEIIQTFGWTQTRITSALDRLLREGIVWVDYDKGDVQYWFPSLFIATREEVVET